MEILIFIFDLLVSESFSLSKRTLLLVSLESKEVWL